MKTILLAKLNNFTIILPDISRKINNGVHFIKKKNLEVSTLCLKLMTFICL